MRESLSLKHFIKWVVCKRRKSHTCSFIRSLVVSWSEESMAEWTQEVRVLNFEVRRGYAAEGKDGIWSNWAPGFWITCFHM